MKTNITIKVSHKQKVSYGTSEETLGSVTREFDQELTAKEAKRKALESIEEAKQEVIEIFNRKIEAETLAAAKLAEEESKKQQ